MTALEVGTLESLWAQKLKQLHGLAVSIATERSRGNEAGVQALRDMFVRVVADMRGIAERIRVNESELDWVEQFLVNVDNGARTLVGIPNALLDASGLKPLLYVALALVAMHYLTKLFPKGVRQ